MKFKITQLPPLLAALALCGGCVESKTLVGDKVPVLKPEVWNAKWRDGDGEIVRTKIENSKLGVIQMTTKRSWLNPPEAQEIWIRELGPLEIANQKGSGTYYFARIAVDGAHLVIFDANKRAFAGLIKRHDLAGKIEKDKDGKLTGSYILEGFSDKDFERLKKEGFDVGSLFDADPDEVLVRDTRMPFW